MSYRLGKKSLSELDGVDNRLVDIVKLAITYTKQDFTVHDGIRTLREQEHLVDIGASHTLRSKHLTGHAVDLVPYINGKLRWEWMPIFTITEAVKRAASELGVKIRWGGCWDVDDLCSSDQNPRQMCDGYVVRRKNIGKRAFIDGPHFELVDF